MPKLSLKKNGSDIIYPGQLDSVVHTFTKSISTILLPSTLVSAPPIYIYIYACVCECMYVCLCLYVCVCVSMCAHR